MASETLKKPLPNFWQLIKPYKIPLVLFLTGLALFSFGLIFPIVFQKAKPDLKLLSPSSLKEDKSSIKVDVGGSVSKPGVYELSIGSRVEDVLKLAGGFTEDADKKWLSKNLNLARGLEDGEKVYIPSLADLDFEGLGLVEGIKEKININSASTSELDSLPGIGPVTAKKIISNRPYQKVEDLTTKKVVNKSVFEKLKDLVRTH